MARETKKTTVTKTKKSGQKKTVKRTERKTTKAAAKKTTAKNKLKKEPKKKKTSVAKKEPVKKKTTTKAKTKTNKSTATPKKNTKVKKTLTTKTGRKVEIIAKRKSKRKTIKGYSKKELAVFKKIILAKRDEIVELLQNLKEQMMDTSTGQYVNENTPYSLHMAEQGTDAQEREKLYLWAQRETKFLSYLEDALQRIENGTYGICIDSLTSKEGPHLIPKERLMAVPHTQHCVACKTKNSKNR